MLQKIDYQDDSVGGEEADRSHLLNPSHYWQVFKRRWVFFCIPLIVTASCGLSVVFLWPPTFLSAGKILVQAQQIPMELVRPTVTSAAQERLQMIEQRTMTRDNLVAIADKLKLFPEKRSLMSVTELVELIKKNIKITPVDNELDFKQRTRNSMENPTIVFSVGFEYGDPGIAAAVANELMTRILNEDLRDRTSRATDTTRFLAREVQKLQADNAALDARIAELRVAKTVAPSGPDQSTTTLAQLKSELIQKSALYSERHPVVQSMKRQVEALEKAVSSKPEAVPKPDADGSASIQALVAQQEALQKNLDIATAKYDAARLGENLEKTQQSEKLEVIEQPTVPQEPIKPKRSKLAIAVLAAAFLAGVGATTLVEMLDKGIRRGADLLGVIDNRLIISIPYISTPAEKRRVQRKRLLLIATIMLLLAAGAVAAYLLLPIDLMIAKARVGLFK